jgi:hypothetical protein
LHLHNLCVSIWIFQIQGLRLNSNYDISFALKQVERESLRSRLVEQISSFKEKTAKAVMDVNVRKYHRPPPGRSWDEFYQEALNTCTQFRAEAERASQELVLFDKETKVLVSCFVSCNAVFWYSDKFSHCD